MNQPTKALDASQKRERILILFDNPANLSLLGAMLSDRYVVFDSVAALDRHDPLGPFDLCIVDSVALARSWQRLKAIRSHYEPLLLPVLALADRRDMGLLSERVREIADDILLRPVDRLELALRVQSLLRLRTMSVELSDLGNRFVYEQRIAQRLQEAALPHIAPLPGLRWSAVYRAGSSDATVGGDWYDALRLPDGRIVFMIGDVTGSGLEAAVTMTNVRQALRGIAFLHSDPAMMLDAADGALNASEPDRIVTAFAAVYDPASSELRYSSAGHPWPFIRRADGTVVQLEITGTPLGLPWRRAHTSAICKFGRGDMLVLYTDGLVEAERDAVLGEEKLARYLATLEPARVSDIALAVYDHLIAGAAVDDIAIAAFEVTADEGRMRRWRADSRKPLDVRTKRDELLESLKSQHFTGGALAAAETVLAELIGNVVRYAPGPFEVVVDFSDDSAIVHVFDQGPGFDFAPRLPRDMLSEAGRGLFIVAALATDFTVERRIGGGSHARAVVTRDQL